MTASRGTLVVMRKARLVSPKSGLDRPTALGPLAA